MVQKDPTRPRGRPRAYDPEQALARATGAFWHAGYSGTSLDDLSTATGMNRPSLYGAFGDKRSLYLATLERYAVNARVALQNMLDRDLPLDVSLKRVYDGALSLYFSGEDAARGCFLIGTAATEAVTDPGIRTTLGESLRSIDRAFEDRLRHARETGELSRNADPVLLAKMASAILHTLAVRSRAGDSRASLRAVADIGIRLICGDAGPGGNPRK